ncbi:hypothetical protein LMH87_003434 [Akanthomyces muscarius]|uniref:Uncharacterized protein n=1 Tax=Akanthomyces muscarius TaxID=2231603 RepID=A0A9W8UGL2_AKAMU|nr:hypothetical protein LMH87_003434 [Akanthomyces muscarius]KAJ4144553.1 hypothetical protein LMH87_003434 [Akanthomyces muscarius]
MPGNWHFVVKPSALQLVQDRPCDGTLRGRLSDKGGLGGSVKHICVPHRSPLLLRDFWGRTKTHSLRCLSTGTRSEEEWIKPQVIRLSFELELSGKPSM